MIAGNSTAISILLRNLIDNAVRYTPKNSQVSVMITEHGEQVILQVRDNGPGIPEELRSRVFERFYRVLGTKQTGSGLGLAIVQQIVSLHQGEIKLDAPSEGTGLVIRISFPKPTPEEIKRYTIHA